MRLFLTARNSTQAPLGLRKMGRRRNDGYDRRLRVEGLEGRLLLAVGTFLRTDGSVAASAADIYAATAEGTDGPRSGSDSGDESQTFAHVKVIATASGDGSMAFAENESTSLSVPPIDSATPAPYVSAAMTEKRHADADINGQASAGGDGGAGASSTVQYQADPSFPGDLELHGHLFLAAHGGILISENAFAEFPHGVSLSTQVGAANISANFDETQHNWSFSGYIPGYGSNGEVSGTTEDEQLNLHFHFVIEFGDQNSITIGGRMDGHINVGASSGGTADLLMNLHAGAWAYVTGEGEDLPPGDGDGDGDVDGDDFDIWAIGDPRGDADEDGDVDDDDFAIWAANATNVLIVTTDVDETDGDHTYGDLSLREAIALAESNPGHDVIVVAPWVEDIELTLGQITISDGNDVDIKGHDRDALTIRGRVSSPARIFEIESNTIVTMSRLTMTGGQVTGSDDGGGILNFGDLTVDSVVMTNNTSARWGGAIYSTGPLSIQNSLVSENQAQYRGAGVALLTSTLSVSNSSFTNNAVTNTSGHGGGIDANNLSFVTIDTTTFDGNSANAGAGLFLGNASEDTLAATISNSTFSHNAASSGGGGMMLQPQGIATIDIVNTTISTNTAVSYGGGVFLQNGGSGDGIRFINSTIVYNELTSGSTGGGIYVRAQPSKIRFDNTIVAHNLALGSANDIAGLVNSSSSYNLLGPGGSGGLSTSNGNIILTSGQSAGLTPLAHHGGLTLTHALLSTSDAIDAGDNTFAAAFDLDFDQRGQSFDRIVDWWADDLEPRIDIGAVELVFNELYT